MLAHRAGRVLTVAAVLAIGMVAAVRAADTYSLELQFSIAKDAKDGHRARKGEEKRLESVLKARLAAITSEGGSVEIRSVEDIRVRVPAKNLEATAVKVFSRGGLLEVRSLPDVQTAANPKARYVIDFLTVRDSTANDQRLRFRDRESGRVIPMEEFLKRSKPVLTTDDIEPKSAHVVGSGLSLAVRVAFTPKAVLRMNERSMPGDLLVVMLDGKMVSMNVMGTPKPKKLKAPHVKGAKPPKEPKKEKTEKQEPEKKEVPELSIVGGFGTPEEAAQLATVLNSGALPFPLELMGEKVIGE